MAPFPCLVVAALLLVAVTAEADGDGIGRSYGGQARYRRVFSFGDSLTDTGNSAKLPATAGEPFTNAPNGATYFKAGPSGRASDGRLVIDFIVDSLFLPQPRPYLAGKTADDFRRGVNFAVGGGTALDMAFLKTKGIKSFVPVSLSNQTTWFNGVLQRLAPSENERENIAASSLFYLGEIGFNDYSFALLDKVNNDTLGLAKSLVPHIVGVIRAALVDVIYAGAKTIVVTGMIPIGCEPELLALVPLPAGVAARDYYDPKSGCITPFNNLAQLHDIALMRMLVQLQRAHRRQTKIYFGDLYTPITKLVSSPRKYGFGGKPLAACCGGGGGPYNFNFAFFCGSPMSTTCADPSKAVSWDGIHYTEAANKFVADALLGGLQAKSHPANDLVQDLKSAM